ncbi:MAG: undecaprenyl diphosphate synthase family protein, partial [Methanothrix sp.]|nr:undecaprenyl diphosphate synthase family protein [Methanothrix sp.]
MKVSILNPVYAFYERLLERQILGGGRVEHVAVIQDGNRRYARQKHIPKNQGHSLGAQTTDRVLDWCVELGIKHLTVYAFSTENFRRDEEDKRYLFDLIKAKFMEIYYSERVKVNR